MKTDTRKTGADYAKFEDRMPTVKLTDAESLNVASLIAELFESGTIKRADVESDMAEVFGEHRAAEYFKNFDARERGTPWSRRENVQMIGKLLPRIPGATREKKADWIMERLAPCFEPERWATLVLPYALERIAEYEAAGGTLETWPEVIVEPDPEPPAEMRDFPEKTVFLHADISNWPATAKLDATVDAQFVRYDYDKRSTWPIAKTRASDGGPLVGNCLAVIERGGKWYCVAWDWMRHGQSAKGRSSFGGAGGHMPGPLADFKPVSGERYGHVVSTPCRGPERTINERSNVSWAVWP